MTDETGGEAAVVEIETSMGMMKARLWSDGAPETAANFLAYVDDEYYDGLIFHRVIDGFMVQGGGFAPDMNERAGRPPISNEASADLRNTRGSLAMARTNDVNSATSQFFINLADNSFLDHRNETPEGFGYCAFGELTDGLDVLDAIAKVSTGRSGHHDDVPEEPVTILSIRRAEA